MANHSSALLCFWAVLLLAGVLAIHLAAPLETRTLEVERTRLADTPADLTAVSDVIVTARPARSRVNRLLRDGGDVYAGCTRTKIRVVSVLQGAVCPGQVLTLTEECYTTDLGTVLWTQGGYLPAEPGTEYLFFLKKYEAGNEFSGTYFPVDLEYGRYVLPQGAARRADTLSAAALEVGPATDLDTYRAWYDAVMTAYWN